MNAVIDEPCPYGTPGCRCHRLCEPCSFAAAFDLYQIEIAAGRANKPALNAPVHEADWWVDEPATTMPWWQRLRRWIMDQNDDDFDNEPMGLGVALAIASVASSIIIGVVMMALLVVLS